MSDISDRKHYTFTITFDDGRPEKSVTFVQGRIKLKVLKLIERARKSNDWTDLIDALAAMLGITSEEADEILLDDWQALATAMQEGAIVPNDGGATPT